MSEFGGGAENICSHGVFRFLTLNGHLIAATEVDYLSLTWFPLGQKMSSRRCDGIGRRATLYSRDRDSALENRLMYSATTRVAKSTRSTERALVVDADVARDLCRNAVIEEFTV